MDGIIQFLSSDAGIHLLALAERLALGSCSGWEEKAEEHLPHALALPSAPAFLTFPRNSWRGNVARAA